MESKRFIMSREHLSEIWKRADWRKVIEAFGLKEDKRRRTKPDEIWIKSPFTNEEVASLHLNVVHNTFKDFSSGMGARVGLLNFCQLLLRKQGREMNCYEVAEWMVKNGISPEIPAISDKDKRRDEKEKKERERRDSKPAEGNKPISSDLRSWFKLDHPKLKERKISRDTCKYLGCGFLPERKGLGKKSPLNGRIVFQIRSVADNEPGLKPIIITHTGRALTKEQETSDGKYWGFPFFKGLELYNQDCLLLDPLAKFQVERFGIVLVEGFFDVAAMIEGNCLNVCALMGSRITNRQIERLKYLRRHVNIPKITLFLDRDEAGISGARETFLLLSKNGFLVECFDWSQTFDRSGFPPVMISDKIKDPGNLSGRQLSWLRKIGKV